MGGKGKGQGDRREHHLCASSAPLLTQVLCMLIAASKSMW